MDKVLKEKRAKGYTDGVDAPAFKQVLGAVDSGLRPMLLTDATEAGEGSYIESQDWGAEEKLNGKRIMLDIFPDGRVVGVNRKGLECPIPEVVVKVFEPQRGGRGGPARRAPRLTLDGEMIGEVYHAFDLLLEDDDAGHQIDRKASSMIVRHNRLVMALTPFLNNSLKIVSLEVNAENKRALVDRLKAGRREGVVFKKLAAPYAPGRIENLGKATAVKCKFYAEGAFLIRSWNDRSSVSLGALDAETNVIVPVGNVTVPEKYKDQINSALMGCQRDGLRQTHLVRVRYLYATPNRILYQPNLDPDDAGNVVYRRDEGGEITKLSDLKLEGKDEA